MKRYGICVLIFLALLIEPLVSEVPVRTEENIYSIAAFSGKDYALTFAKEEAHSIYIYSDADNFLSLKKNFVYFWPITDQWIIDDSVLDYTYSGNVEIIDKKGVITKLSPVDYTFFNMRGTYQNNWHILTGDEAQKEWNEYIKMVLDYQESISVYNKAVTDYQSKTTELFNEIMALRTQNKPYETLLEELGNLREPVEPSTPQKYTVPPSKIQVGFQINLPPGEYTIRFVTSEGNIVEGSEKKLCSIAPRRINSIGYEVFPERQWTQPTLSSSPASVLYLDGSSDIYLRPFYQNEYISLNYNKLVNNQASGNPNLYSWVKIQQVPESTIQINQNQEISDVDLNKYIVEQSKTTALGYTIVPYDPLGAHKGKIPSMEALYIPLSPDMKEAKFSVIGLDDSLATKSSARTIRIIDSIHHEFYVVLILFIPLLVGAIVLLRRKKSYKNLSD
jgi:hypothetical protein